MVFLYLSSVIASSTVNDTTRTETNHRPSYTYFRHFVNFNLISVVISYAESHRHVRS
jgi:hypothetical protein